MTDKTASCSAGHTFDRAKEGYFNLLPVQAKQSKDPGDSPEMVQARRTFLNTGSYDPIIDAVAAIIKDHAQSRSDLCIVDAGCGEGYYLNRISTMVDHANYGGIDISKHAIKAAAKINRAITWVVASNRQLPFPSQSVDIVLCAFGFPVWHEFKRVLKPDGIVIMVDPGTDHLLELRQALYPTVKQKEDTPLVAEGFEQSDTQRVTYAMTLSGDVLRNLIAMTPHQHRVTADQIDQVCENPLKQITADSLIRIYHSF